MTDNRTDSISLKQYLDHEIAAMRSLIDERDRLYSTQFKSAETAVNAAFLAQQLSVKEAFTASQKAIDKAEAAQATHDAGSNEFRGQLYDQARTFMPRTETEVIKQSLEEKLDALRTSNEKTVERLQMDIASLRESRSEGAGRASQQSVYLALAISAIGFGIGLISIVVTIVIRLFS